MAEYNGFKIKRPHSLTPLTSVYEAEAVDGRPGRFALKIFHPPASSNVRRLYAIEGWLLAAERQQQSAKKDGTVVEVLALGRCAEGAFAVFPWQERFLEPWIKTLQAKGDTLRALATCLLNTIESWEKETGGPHGNLKSSNIFLDHSGPLTGMTATLSDPAFLPGTKTEALRLADLNAVGTMLATIVRRRPPGAWPIEEAPEWKALGNAGKAWLDFCNYLLNPQPGEGEVTMANARLRLKKVPKDANPVRTALMTLAALLVLGVVGLVAFARFGNPTYMPDQVFRLAQKVGNTQIKPEVPRAWIDLCVAWDTWLTDLQGNGPRLLQTEALWDHDDQLHPLLTAFVANSKDLLPATLVPEAANEKRLGVLANSPPDAVLNELQLPSVRTRITEAGRQLNALSLALENWARWDQLRKLQQRMVESKFTNAAAALQLRLPPLRGSEAYKKIDMARTLKFLNDLSLDNTGTLPLASRWSEISHLQADMLASGEAGDRIQKAMPELILRRLVDMSSLSDFADSLVSPLDELRLHRKQFLDPAVVRERFLKESALLQETAEVAVEDFPRWVEELHNFSLVAKADDPRLAPELDANKDKLPPDAVDLEREAPAAEPNGLATLSADDFKSEFDRLTVSLKALRDRPVVNRDLPDVRVDTGKMSAAIQLLSDRLQATLVLLKPETWMAKAKLAYGIFTETKQRWAAWQQAALNPVTADMLRGAANRERFRGLRRDERKVKDWIDGLEGPTGFAALKLPDLAGTASAESTAELMRLEGVLRDRAVTAVAALAEWRNAVPVTAWAAEGASVRAPLDAHRTWLTQLPDFASNLDQLGELLANGFGYDEGVSEVASKLRPRTGLADLGGKPAAWYAEANQLARLVPISDRGGLLAAAQAGGLARKLTVWRKLGEVPNWPAGAEDFDLDGGVVTEMRKIVKSEVKEEARRTSLLEEMARVTRQRFNRAARTAARAEAELAKMFSRLKDAGLTEKDLDEPVGYNLALWRLKRSNWNEKNLDRLRVRRDTFVTAVRAIPSAAAQPDVSGFVEKISALELKDDPNRVPTPSPATVGWQEDVADEGLTLIATWKNVRMEYSIVQPLDDTPPFFLARRAMAVGEFLDLMAGRPAEAKLVKAALPEWATTNTPNKPWNKPIAWRPRSDFSGALEPNPRWIYAPDAMVQGLLDNTELIATTPPLKQAAEETPTLRSPLQQVSPAAAKILAEKLLGARLPTTKEWQAVIKATGATAANGYFRGPNFQKLWSFIEGYHAGGQTWNWRPNEGIFLPTVAVPGPTPGSTMRRKLADDGSAGPTADESRFWFRSVDDGPKSGVFVNLTGNVSVFLAGEKPNEFYVAGGSVLSPPGVDFTQPQKVEAGNSMIGAKTGSEAYSDVGIRPAFDAPPGFKERYKLLVLVRDQKYLTL